MGETATPGKARKLTSQLSPVLPGHRCGGVHVCGHGSRDLQTKQALAGEEGLLQPIGELCLGGRTLPVPKLNAHHAERRSCRQSHRVLAKLHPRLPTNSAAITPQLSFGGI